jgi:small-conductance mechanosensitive channel
VDRIINFAADFLQPVIDYLNQTAIWTQFVVIAVLFVSAVLLANRVEPILEVHARKIKGMPGLLRIVVALLRRFKWLFFVIFLIAAYVGTSVLGWPGSNYLIYAAALLSGSWLLISVVSLVVRSRTLGRAFAFVAWIYVATLILGIVDDVAVFLDAAGFNFGSVRLSLLTALQTAFLLGIALWLSLSIGKFFDRRIQRIDELTPSLRVLLGKITRISLVILAGLVVISGAGIDLTALTVLSGAVGVGIGFGLQKVVSNFISGIIILLDQSIKPGDTISLGETFGWIRELRARFVSVITRDGREFLIPNEDFITREVINWSFSDRYVRLDVDFGVSYDADPHEVIKVAIAASGAVDRVDSRYKPPVCWMTAFGNSSLDFRLRFWIDDPQQGLTNVRGKVLLALWDAFKEHDIDIPYPHREVIFKNPVHVQST